MASSQIELPDRFASLRHAMVETQLRSRGLRDERVLAAMGRVPRHEFVPSYKQDDAYEDHPILIAENQTISQPFMVAAMAEAAEIKQSEVLLEVGTGSGYEAAVLAELAAQVFTIERFASLAESAQRLLARLNYSNVAVVIGDGSKGLPERAPFDAIIVAAAAPQIPPALVEQLREGGRLVIPIGTPEEQELYVVHKLEGGPVTRRSFACKFVPLVGRYGFHPPS